MKNIKYMGYEYEVPDWAKFIATDEDGDIYVFETTPELYEDDVVGFWVRGRNKGRTLFVSNPGWDWFVSNPGWDWRETLAEF